MSRSTVQYVVIVLVPTSRYFISINSQVVATSTNKLQQDHSAYHRRCFFSGFSSSVFDHHRRYRSYVLYCSTVDYSMCTNQSDKEYNVPRQYFYRTVLCIVNRQVNRKKQTHSCDGDGDGDSDSDRLQYEKGEKKASTTVCSIHPPLPIYQHHPHHPHHLTMTKTQKQTVPYHLIILLRNRSRVQ